MAKILEHKKALKLRQQGKSYSQIKKILGLSKSTLSLWLRDYPLSKEQIRALRDWSETRIEKYRETRRKQRETRLAQYYKSGKQRLLPASSKALYIAGLFLYWGEGTKLMSSPLVISNTDPSVIKFSLFWMNKILKIPKEKIKFKLHLYSDMNIEEEHVFWSKQLRIPTKQFRKPYIKTSNSRSINYKTFNHGTCEIHGGNVRLKEQIMTDITVIYDKYKMGQ